MFVCGIDDLLYSVHIGGKRRNDDPCILMVCKKRIKGPAHRSLGSRKAQPLCIRGITHQCKHALLPELCKALQVNGITEYRRIIHLKIPCMHYYTGR